MIQLKQLDQTGFELPVRFQRSVSQNVLNVRILTKMAANEDGSVTPKRILLRTHEGHGVPIHPLAKAIQTVTEVRQFGDPLIVHPAVDDRGGVQAAGSQLVSQEDVGNALGRQQTLQLIAVELGLAGAERHGPDIRHDIDAMEPQQREKGIWRMRRVADGEEVAPRCFHC